MPISPELRMNGYVRKKEELSGAKGPYFKFTVEDVDKKSRIFSWFDNVPAGSAIRIGEFYEVVYYEMKNDVHPENPYKNIKDMIKIEAPVMTQAVNVLQKKLAEPDWDAINEKKQMGYNYSHAVELVVGVYATRGEFPTPQKFSEELKAWFKVINSTQKAIFDEMAIEEVVE